MADKGALTARQVAPDIRLDPGRGSAGQQTRNVPTTSYSARHDRPWCRTLSESGTRSHDAVVPAARRET